MLKKKSVAAWVCIVLFLASATAAGYGVEQNDEPLHQPELLDEPAELDADRYEAENGEHRDPDSEYSDDNSLENLETDPESLEIIQNSSEAEAKRSRISIGLMHILVVDDDGSVWSWGYNGSGALGTGNFVNASTPQKIKDLEDVVSVSAGYLHSLALKSDGTVWAWGHNDFGALGDGTMDARCVPAQVPNLENIKHIAAGVWFSLAVQDDGTMWAWGFNLEGTLGDGGTDIFSLVPVQVKGLQNVVEADALFHSMALTSDGNLWIWGSNVSCQAGDGGANAMYNYPRKTDGLENVKAISAGGFSLAVTSDGKIWEWGENRYGSHSVPYQYDDFEDAVAVAAGYDHILVLKEDGSVWARGSNKYGQLGDESIAESDTLIPVEGLENIVEISANDCNSAALDDDGNVWVWGKNFLWDAEPADFSAVPVNVFSTSNGVSEPEPKPELPEPEHTRIAAGNGFVLAVENGNVWSWGENHVGQLGYETSWVNTQFPQMIPGLDNVISVSAGHYHGMALKKDGTVWIWGSYADIGGRITEIGRTPVQVAGLRDVKYIASGDNYHLAVKKDGTVWSWGYNLYGSLGNGSETHELKRVPAQVGQLRNIVMVAAYSQSLALSRDGTVWAWGENFAGAVGDGTYDNRYGPVKLKDLKNIVHIHAGWWESMAVSLDGQIWSWGNLFTNSPTLQDDRDVTAATGHSNFQVMLKKDGSVWANGSNNFGQLGDGTTTDRKSSKKIESLVNVVELTAGNEFTAALDGDGQIWAWGRNSGEILGEYYQIKRDSAVPLKVFPVEQEPEPVQLEAEMEMQVNKGKTYDIMISGAGLDSLEDTFFRLTYSGSMLELVDLCALTTDRELGEGPVAETAIVIESVSQGEIIFSIDKAVPDGKKWSGVLNVIRFQALQNGEAAFSAAEAEVSANQSTLQVQSAEIQER